MDLGSFDRVSRTLTTFWAYVTEVVGEFFRAEPTDNPDRIDIDHVVVYEKESGNAENLDGRKEGGEDVQSAVSTVSVVCTSRPAVAWQQLRVDVSPEPDAERLQYTQEATRGSDNQVQMRLIEVATPPSITKQTAVKLPKQSDDVSDGVVCEDAFRSAAYVPEDHLGKNESKSTCDKTATELECRRNLQLREEEEGDENLPECGEADMDVAGLLDATCLIQHAWTEEETAGKSGLSLISDEPTTDERQDMMDEVKNEGKEECDGSVVEETTTNTFHIDEGEGAQNKSEDVKDVQYISKPITDNRLVDMNIKSHSTVCAHGGQAGEVMEINTSEDVAECSIISAIIHNETTTEVKLELAGINTNIYKGRGEIKEYKHSLEEEILVTHPTALTVNTMYNNRGEMNAELNMVSLGQWLGPVWSQELNCLADEESQEGVPECHNGRDQATAQTLVQQGDSGEKSTAHIAEEVEGMEAVYVEAAEEQEETEVKAPSDESHWDMIFERQARVTCLNALPEETETSMNEPVVDQLDKAVGTDERLNRLACWTEVKTLSDSTAPWESLNEDGEIICVDVSQNKKPPAEETVMFTVSSFDFVSELGEPMDITMSADDNNNSNSSLPEEDEGIKNCSEPQIRTDPPDNGTDAEDVTTTNDKETVNLLTGTSLLSKITDGNEMSSITRSESLTSTDSELPGKLGNMKSDVPNPPQQNSENKLNAEPIGSQSKPGKTVKMAREMVIHKVMEHVNSFATPDSGENSGQTPETDEEILDMWIETVLEDTEPEERKPELAGLQPNWDSLGWREQLAAESNSRECVLEVSESAFSDKSLSEESLADSTDLLMAVSHPGSAQDIQEAEDTPTEPAQFLHLSTKLDFHDGLETNVGHSHVKESPAETPETRLYDLQPEHEESTQDQGELFDSLLLPSQDVEGPSGVPMEGAEIKSQARTDVLFQDTGAVVEFEPDVDTLELGSESIYYQDFTDSSFEQFDMSDLDFTPQKWRITVKNSLTRPPKHPRKLLHMPSVEPSPPKSSSQSPMKMPLGGLGVGIKLPGLGAGLPVLKKAPTQVNTDTGKHCSKQMPVQQSVVEEGSSPKAEVKPKWSPPGRPGFGMPLMSELKSKLKKTDE